LGVVAGRFSAAGDNLSNRNGRRTGAASRGRRARSEAEAQARPGNARSSRTCTNGTACAGTSGAGYAGRAARCQDDRTQPGSNTIYAPTGTAPTTISHNAIEALPQGENATVEKIVLQFPGVTQDSAAGANYHVRNEHANVQIRINGIMLPDGVSGFGTFLDAALIGNISLITGALPPQFGLRTSGVLDIQTRSDAFNNIGTAGIYAGSRGTFTPSFEYGGTVGQTQYFFTGRFFESNIGLENPTPSWNAIHDHTEQERGFGYVSTLLDPYTRFTFITGASYARFQIPDTPGLPSNFTAFGVSSFNSALLNENQFEQNYFGIAAVQRSINGADVQFSYFTRYSSVHFVPDTIGDLVFNGVASNVFRSDLANGVTTDAAYRLNDAHTLRGGLLLHRRDRRHQHQHATAGRRRCSGRCAVHSYRSQQKGWLYRRLLCPGRMADHESAHPEHWPALRPVLGLRQRKPVQSTL
jgi:hypothetical protein